MTKNLLQVIVIRRSGAIPQPLGGGDRMGELFASSKNLLHSLSKNLIAYYESGFMKTSRPQYVVFMNSISLLPIKVEHSLSNIRENTLD